MDVKNKTQPEARCGIQLRKSRNPDGKKTGVTGVQFCPKGKWAGTYSAIVRVNGICWAADGFRSIDEAAAAREKAKQEMIAWGSYNSSAYDSPNYREQMRKNWSAIGEKAAKRPETVWYIRSPQGAKIKVCNLCGWARENAQKFGMEPNDHNGGVIESGFAAIKRSYTGARLQKGRLFAVTQYKGWQLDGWEDDHGELCSTSGPPVRGEFFVKKQAALKARTEEKKANTAKKYHEQMLTAACERYRRRRADGEKAGGAVVGNYVTHFDCKDLPVAERGGGKPVLLKSPDGELILVRNLSEWLRENCRELFAREPTPQNVRTMLTLFAKAKSGKRRTAYGWTVLPPEQDE